MAYIVEGQNAVLELYKAGGYRLIVCAKGMGVSVTTPMVPTSTPDSGVWATFRPGPMTSWSLTFEGVLVLRDLANTVNVALETITEQVRANGYDAKVTFTDNEGYSNFLAGKVYIPQTDINALIPGFATFSITLQGSGPLNINGGSLPGGGTEVFTLFYTANGSENGIISDSDLIGREILSVHKGADEPYEVDTTGSPTEGKCIYDSSAGELDFAYYAGYQFPVNQRFRILYK